MSVWEQRYNYAIDFIVNQTELCVADKNGFPQSGCKFEDITGGDCEYCWRRFLETGSFWEEIPEQDPDRKWKEMRESDEPKS